MYKTNIKPWLDRFFAVVLLIVLALPMLFIALLIKLDSRGPVLFKQQRVGRGEKLFEIYKFRTMYTYAPGEMPTVKLKNSRALITRVGRILRVSSIDELPQLINILKGEMSFVGYRPLIVNEEDTHSARRQYNVYSVLPGITGLAQVRGRDELCAQDKARYDGIYVKNISFSYDFIILLKTITTVIYARGYREGGS